MNTAREEILSRIGRALTDRPTGGPTPRNYHRAGTTHVADVIELFASRVLDYRAAVRRCTADQVAAAIADARAAQHAERVVVPGGFPSPWLVAGGVPDDPPLSTDELELFDGVVTTCAVAIAETGTIVLDAGPGQGRRALTLVPDYHLVIVRAEQIVHSVPDAVSALTATRPLTWISGPSATSDIELVRVEGVHGPRRLEVIIVT
jgi:L-lactate dehydrogenase complex protein LldG